MFCKVSGYNVTCVQGGGRRRGWGRLRWFEGFAKQLPAFVFLKKKLGMAMIYGHHKSICLAGPARFSYNSRQRMNWNTGNHVWMLYNIHWSVCLQAYMFPVAQGRVLWLAFMYEKYVISWNSTQWKKVRQMRSVSGHFKIRYHQHLSCSRNLRIKNLESAECNCCLNKNLSWVLRTFLDNLRGWLRVDWK